ncbi:MAG: hypothetical protein KC657_17965 [Myxococcales bacterium]|nr:hypothetical protein [Myxococcales bacterium]
MDHFVAHVAASPPRVSGWLRVATPLAIVAGVCAIACSAAPTQDDSGQSGSWPVRSFQPKEPAAEESPTQQGGTAKPAPPVEADAGTDAAPSGVCAPAPNLIACYDCCEKQAPPNAVQIWSNAFGFCLCETPGPCASACGTSFCRGNAPSAACDRCIDQMGGACSAAADTACLAAPQCAPLTQCERASACDAKPMP